MNCTKCGRELREQQVFCEICLAEMARYPVDSSTPIQLPLQSSVPQMKKHPAKKRPVLTPEERISRLRSSSRLLALALGVTLAAFVLSVLMLLHLLDARDKPSPTMPSDIASAGWHLLIVSRETS